MNGNYCRKSQMAVGGARWRGVLARQRAMYVFLSCFILARGLGAVLIVVCESEKCNHGRRNTTVVGCSTMNGERFDEFRIP